jgi:hypothetical protein
MYGLVVAVLPVIAWLVFLAALVGAPYTESVGRVAFWLALLAFPAASLLIESMFLRLHSRPRRLAAYALVVLAGVFMPLKTVLARPVPLESLLLAVALMGWVPVAALSFLGDQPSLREGRASPTLFALLAALQAMGYMATF